MGKFIELAFPFVQFYNHSVKWNGAVAFYYKVLVVARGNYFFFFKAALSIVINAVINVIVTGLVSVM